MKKTILFLPLLLLCSCNNPSSSLSSSPLSSFPPSVESGSSLTEVDMTLTLTIDSETFHVDLFDNEATRRLVELLPLTLDFSDLNDNEKYVYLEESLPTESEPIGTIEEGDFLLYGSSCLVFFYESFKTPYSYTRLGIVVEKDSFLESLGEGNVRITLQQTEKAL